MKACRCLRISPSGTGITVRADGKLLRLVTMSSPSSVSLGLAWYCCMARKYTFNRCDHSALSAGMLSTSTTIEWFASPVYVAMTSVGDSREQAHCSTRYSS